MDIKDLHKLKEEKIELEKKLKDLSEEYSSKTMLFIKDYFNGEIPKELALSKNQFINISRRGFSIEKSDSGAIYWKVRGNIINIKDGSIGHGTSEKELYQGEYESFSKELKNHTLEKAQEITKPIFPISPKYYNGSQHANYGYLLAENKDLGLVLIWRKAGTSYVDRMSGNVPSESALEIIHLGKNSSAPSLKNIFKEPVFEDVVKRNEDIFYQISSRGNVNLAEGGKFKKEVILRNAELISSLFGSEAVNDIVTKLEVQLQRKKLTGDSQKKKTM